MLRNRCPWFRRPLTTAFLLLVAPGWVAADEPAPPAARPGTEAGDAPVNIVLGNQADLDAVWKAFANPDFVILRGDQYARLRGRPGAVGDAPAPPWGAAVASVSVEGTVAGDLAELGVEFGVVSASDGPVWADLRLDGMTLTGATEAGVDLPLRAAEGGAWQAEVSGRGKHAVRVTLLAPVRSRPEGRRLDLTIPEAASTRLSVVVPQRVVDASAGPGEPVGRASVAGAPGSTRLTAGLTPRAKLGLVWRVDEESDAALPPLLTAQGEIAVEVDPGSFRTRSSWSVRSVRGASRSLELRVDPADEVIELEVDGRRPATRTERVGATNRVTIPLAEPLAPGQERRLVIGTRRATPAGASARVAFTGFPLVNAREQAGAVGVAPTGNLWVTGTPGRGVRQIDPRTELPADLRARPATELAYQFSEQPFELTLRVESSPPLVRAVDRTTVSIDATSARVDTWVDVETSGGRLYELTLGLPPRLEVESVGPADVVGSLHTGALPPSALPPGLAGLRLLTVRLGAGAREAGKFAVHLVGRQVIDAGGREVPVALFQPLGVSSTAGRVAVLTDPSLTADLGGAGGSAGAFRPALLSPPPDWPWPSGRAPASPPMLWLRHDDTPAVLPLTVTTHPRTLAHASTLQVRVDRREVEVRQETELSAQFGAFDHVDVSVPAGLLGPWAVEGAAVANELGRGPRGDRLVRLKLAAELTRTAVLRFRYRLAVDPRLSAETPVEVGVPWFRVGGAASASPTSPPRASVSLAAGLSAEVTGGAWAALPGPTSPGDEDAAALRLVRADAGTDRDDRPRAGDLTLRVSSATPADLPTLVAPRLALRTVQVPEGELRTTATYRVESHESSVSFALPPGAELNRVRIGGEPVRQVERVARGTGRAGAFRVAFPARAGGGPTLLELDYVVPAGRAGAAWSPPRLLDGGVVQETLWEVRVPWNRAVVGVPAGWSDENEWYWDAYVWKRRPSRTPAALAEWVGGPAARRRPAADAEPDADPRGGDHGYLFARPGGPVAFPVWTASRAWLVAVCSGTALAVGGLLILVWRPDLGPAWAGTFAVAATASALLHPSLTLLAVQSGTVGLLLTALLAVMQRLVGRRRPGRAVYKDPGGRAAGLGVPGSTMSRVVAVGSDDSTAVRSRPVAAAAVAAAAATRGAPHEETASAAAPGVVGPGPGARPERAGPGGTGA